MDKYYVGDLAKKDYQWIDHVQQIDLKDSSLLDPHNEVPSIYFHKNKGRLVSSVIGGRNGHPPPWSSMSSDIKRSLKPQLIALISGKEEAIWVGTSVEASYSVRLEFHLRRGYLRRVFWVPISSWCLSLTPSFSCFDCLIDVWLTWPTRVDDQITFPLPAQVIKMPVCSRY